MKIWELASGWLVHLDQEENDLLEFLIKNPEHNLTEREEVVAQKLIAKDVLIREELEDKDKYSINFRKDVWRD